jgi:hypothetical protein
MAMVKLIDKASMKLIIELPGTMSDTVQKLPLIKSLSRTTVPNIFFAK